MHQSRHDLPTRSPPLGKLLEAGGKYKALDQALWNRKKDNGVHSELQKLAP